MTTDPFDDNEENLPAVSESFEVDIPAPLPLEPTSTFQDAVEADLRFANGMVAACHMAWTQAKTISQISILVNTSFKAMQERRNILGIAYGHISKGPNGRTIDNLPD